MQKIILVLVAVAVYTNSAIAAVLPTYDIAAYCKQVSAAGGGSYMIESSCIDMEKEAKSVLETMDIEQKILNYCHEVAEVSGGSYIIFQECVSMEVDAKQNLSN